MKEKENKAVAAEQTKREVQAPKRTKIIIRRTFGEHDLMDLYTDYVADKILAAGGTPSVSA